MLYGEDSLAFRLHCAWAQDKLFHLLVTKADAGSCHLVPASKLSACPCLDQELQQPFSLGTFFYWVTEEMNSCFSL